MATYMASTDWNRRLFRQDVGRWRRRQDPSGPGGPSRKAARLIGSSRPPRARPRRSRREPLVGLCSTMGGDEVDSPGWGRHRHLRGEDLGRVHPTTAGCRAAAADHPPFPDAAVAHLGVDRVWAKSTGVGRPGGRSRRPGGEHEDLVLVQVDLQVRHELRRGRSSPAASRRSGQPGDALGDPACGSSSARRRPLGPVVHLAGADLHLERSSAWVPITVVCSDW